MTNKDLTRKQKPLSPLQAMVQRSKVAPEISQAQSSELSSKPLSSSSVLPSVTGIDVSSENRIFTVDPQDICRWQFKDRPVNELGDLTALADDLKINGQIQPIILRANRSDSREKYELIVGERRWQAAKLAKIKLLAIIRPLLDNEAAILQASENDMRKDISDFAKSLSYQRLLDANIITPKDIEFKLNKSQSYIRNMLSFSRLDSELVTAFGDLSFLSARTAYEIVRWQEKGEAFKANLIKHAAVIRDENFGEKQLAKLMAPLVGNPEKSLPTQTNTEDSKFRNYQEVAATDGRHIFTWRNDSNGNRSISFPKDVRAMLDFEKLERAIVENVIAQFKQLLEDSK